MMIFPSIVDKISTLKDGGLKITLETAELNTDQMAEIMAQMNKSVFAAISPTELRPDQLDIKEMPVEFKSDKSQSQRIRSILFVYWEKYKPTKYFDTFYKRKTNEFIEMIKDRI